MAVGSFMPMSMQDDLLGVGLYGDVNGSGFNYNNNSTFVAARDQRQADESDSNNHLDVVRVTRGGSNESPNGAECGAEGDLDKLGHDEDNESQLDSNLDTYQYLMTPKKRARLA